MQMGNNLIGLIETPKEQKLTLQLIWEITINYQLP